jgi:hypothetical protein
MKQRRVVHEQLATIYKSASQKWLSQALLATLPTFNIVNYLVFKIYSFIMCWDIRYV